MPGKTAEEMALDQKEISVAEFFEKNRHLLGFDNPAKALITVVKEGVDNSLDACEEAGKLPYLNVNIDEVGSNKYEITLKDNGPGIVKEQMPSIFGKLLYGSKFHSRKQSRGQQGIGISASVLYSQLTTGRPAIITSRTDMDSPPKQFKLKIDTIKNEPEILKEKELEDDFQPGTEIKVVVEGKYIQRYHSVDEYLKQTAIANPYARIQYSNPEGEDYDFERAAEKLPPEPKEIKPHPYGVELGVLGRMLKNTDSNKVLSFLQNEFTRIGRTSAEEICRLAEVDPDEKPENLNHSEQEGLLDAMQKVKIQRPPTDCLSPIGAKLIKNGLGKEIDAEFITSSSRDPEVYRGNPFQVEVGIAYGGELEEMESDKVKVMRYANKVPLLYQSSSCAITKALENTDWKRYGLEQPGSNGTPKGPAVIFVHLCSTWVPFTSESKESIARYPKIVKEIKLALQECARDLKRHLSRKQKGKKEKRRKKIFSNYMPLVLENAVELAEEGEELTIDPIMQRVIDEELVEKVEEAEEVEEGDVND